MKNLKIKAKIITGFTISALFMLILGGIGANGLDRLKNLYHFTINVHGNPLIEISNALLSLQGTRFEVRGAILHAGDQEQLRQIEASIKEDMDNFETLMGKYSESIVRADVRQIYDEAMDIYASIYKPTVLEALDKAKKGHGRDELVRYLSITKPASDEMVDKLVKAMKIKVYMMDKSKAEADAVADDMVLIFIGVIIASVVISFALGLYISRLISRPLLVLTAFMKKAGATGDLSLGAEDRDIIGESGQGRDEIWQTIAACAAFIERITAASGVLEAVSRGDLTRELALLSDKDVIGLSLKKMTGGLNSMIEEIRQRDNLLHAVNSAADILLRADENNFEASLQEGIALIANCVSVDRVYIWKAERVKGDFSYYLDYKYVDSLGRQGEPVPLGARFKGSTGFEKTLTGRNCVNGPISGLSEEWRELSDYYNVRSILIIPLFLRDGFWGQISFDDCREERVFSESEVSILRSASLMIANARNRHEEAALVREADQRSRLMLDTMPLGCQLWSQNKSIIDCNEALVKLFGLRDKQEFIDRFFELSPEFQPDGRPSEETALMWLDTALGGQYCVFEWQHQTLDGTPMPAEITITRVRYGNEYVLMAYTRDLREHNRMMKKIESLLFETQAANHAKSEFMARMSHEMLTPMNAIMGLTQVAQMSELPEGLQGYLEEIDNASNQLLRLINDVLEMSNMTFDIFKLDNLAFSFAGVFDDALKVVSRFMDAKQQIFTYDLDRSIPPLLIGDKKRLGQVMVKIMENASKFTPEHGEIRFTAAVEEKDEETVTLRVEVTDNGLGIAEERQRNLFNVFEQIDGGNTRKQGGVGLGLALAKRIIETMGGRIWVESELGQGSKFTFTCKVRQRQAVYEHPPV